MAQGNKLQIKDPALVLPHPAHADGVPLAQVAVQAGLWAVVLVKDLDRGVGRRGAAEGLGFAGVVSEGLLDFLGRGRGLALELEAHAGRVSVEDGHAVTRRRDAQTGLLDKRRLGVVHAAEDLARLRLELVLLAADEGHDVVDHVHARDARVAGARDGLHGDDADGGDGAERRLEGREGADEPDDGAVGVAHEEALGVAAHLALVRDEVEVG